MNKRLLRRVLFTPAALFLLAFPYPSLSPVFAHGGGLDDRGCHNESATGEYHCHRGPLDGQTFPSKGAATATLEGENSGTSAPGSARSEYNRNAYGDWADLDGDCQDTRDEVLLGQGEDVELGQRGCEVVSGRWEGPYTGRTFSDPGDLHIDHVVPLKEAHVSGAVAWPPQKKRRFANDLDNLLAVEAGANMAKGSRGPSEWMPDTGECAYLEQWVEVKEEWGLNMDRQERQFIKAADCR